MGLTFSRYGVTLRRVEEADIELIRRWRNDPQVAQFMHFREHITEQMQHEWFGRINNENNYFFIIEYGDRPVGMIDTKNIDYTTGTCEGGLFIWDAGCLNSDVALRASMCCIAFNMEKLGIVRGIARILRGNKRAIDYNRMLGYELAPGQEDNELQEYILTRENYEKQFERLERLINE